MPDRMCSAGAHDLDDPSNQITDPKTGRVRCRACKRARNREYAARQRGTSTTFKNGATTKHSAETVYDPSSPSTGWWTRFERRS